MGCGRKPVEGMLRNYPDTQATRDACVAADGKRLSSMQLNAQADKVAKIIAANSKTPEAIPTKKRQPSGRRVFIRYLMQQK